MFELLVGPICSGKSTYARTRAAAGAIIVNDDAFVQALHGGDYTGYSKDLKPLYRQLELVAISTAIAMGRDVVIDRANSVSPSCRMKYVGLAKSLDQSAIAVVFPNEGADIHATRRFFSDPRGLPLEHWQKAARRHESLFVTPDQREGFDRVLSLDERLAEIKKR